MTQPRGHTMPSSRLDALKTRHAILSRDLDEMLKNYAASDFDMRRLKIEKLRIKEEIEQISQTS